MIKTFNTEQQIHDLVLFWQQHMLTEEMIPMMANKAEQHINAKIKSSSKRRK